VKHVDCISKLHRSVYLFKITSSAKLTVLLWHTVTVALAHFSSSEIGVPTILLLPKTTAFFPEITMPDRLINSIQPFGVQGKNPESMSPMATRPSLIVFNLENIYFFH
jgi:hypothetical protein